MEEGPKRLKSQKSDCRGGVSFNGEDVVVDTGTLDNTVPHPDATTRLILVPTVQCNV